MTVFYPALSNLPVRTPPQHAPKSGLLAKFSNPDHFQLNPLNLHAPIYHNHKNLVWTFAMILDLMTIYWVSATGHAFKHTNLIWWASQVAQW